MPTMMQIFAEELQNAGRQNPNIVALSADVSGSTGLKPFAEEFPDRYYEMGVSEQNMISTAAGLALEGKPPSRPAMLVSVRGAAGNRSAIRFAWKKPTLKLSARTSASVPDETARHISLLKTSP